MEIFTKYQDILTIDLENQTLTKTTQSSNQTLSPFTLSNSQESNQKEKIQQICQKKQIVLKHSMAKCLQILQQRQNLSKTEEIAMAKDMIQMDVKNKSKIECSFDEFISEKPEQAVFIKITKSNEASYENDLRIMKKQLNAVKNSKELNVESENNKTNYLLKILGKLK